MKSERGMSLIELLVYSMLLALIIALVGGLLINGLKTDRKIRESAQSTSSGQLAAQSVSRGVRDATALQLSAAGSGQVLKALVVDDALAAPVVSHCAAWYVGDGEVRFTRSSAVIPTPTGAADVQSWTKLASGVEKVGGDPVLALDGSTREVHLKMTLATGVGLKTLIETSAGSRQPATAPSGSVTCF